MKAGLTRLLHETWYEGRRPGLLLRGLERIYAYRQSRLQQHTQPDPELLGRPIVVVGNLTAGGTGKTPLVIRLCELLSASGLKPGVVSRGYGRRSRAQVEVTAGGDVHETGDEPLLIARRCQIPVVVDENREAAARKLFTQGVDVVISDDGLQRHSLPGSLEICVVDAARGLGNQRLLPAGPLREPAARLRSVDFRISNGGAPGQDLGPDWIPMQLEPGPFEQVGGSGRMDAAHMAQHCVSGKTHAIAGIGHPRRFFDQLLNLAILNAREHAYPDHHEYRAADFADKQGTLLMTEKDAIKCERLELQDAWYLPVNAELPEPFEQAFVSRVRQITSAAGEPS